jgi:hypothetical protein
MHLKVYGVTMPDWTMTSLWGHCHAQAKGVDSFTHQEYTRVYSMMYSFHQL